MPASPPVMNSRGLVPVACVTASAARSAMPAIANTAPRDIAPIVLFASTPAIDGVLCSMALAISPVLVRRASRIMWIPGAIKPPMCCPLASTLSTLTAVPASTTQSAERAIVHAPITASQRSAPSRLGSR